MNLEQEGIVNLEQRSLNVIVNLERETPRATVAFHSGCVGRSCYDINAGVRLRLPAHRDHHHHHHHHCHFDDIDDDYHHDCGANNDPPYDLKN